MTLPTSDTGAKRPAATSHPVLDYARRAPGTWVRWIQRSLARENLIAGIKTSLWLVPLTILIWLYAEREQIYNAEDRTIPILVISGSNDRYVELKLPMNDKSVMATLSGPRGRVEEILQRITPSGDSPAVVITIDQSLAAGETTNLDTAQLLAATPIFARSGVTIKNCRPTQIPVFVDEYKEFDAEVQASSRVTNLVGTPIFEPPKVKVRAPASKLPYPAPSIVFADIQSTGLQDKPGQHEATVRVNAPQLSGEGISYTPSTVKATFEVRQPNVSQLIPSVVIFPIGTANMQKKYAVQCADTLPNVTVIGPPDQIAQLSQPDKQPKAILEYSREDGPAGTPRTKRVRFEFPKELPDVHESPEDSQRTVDFTLVERQTD